jgi:hypothetical protein
MMATLKLFKLFKRFKTFKGKMPENLPQRRKGREGKTIRTLLLGAFAGGISQSEILC